MRQTENTEARISTNRGLTGLVETLMRRFKTVMHAVLLTPLYLVSCISIGVALVPGIYFFNEVSNATVGWLPILHYLALGLSAAMGYLLYGFTLILVVPLMNFILRAKLKAWRGTYYSAPAIRWYIHNGLTYLVRYTFLEFITPTPFNILFLRLMGMKIGDGAHINTSFISDPSLIEIGDRVTLGGSVTIVAHYGQGGYLVITPTKVGNGATIGLKATIMGGAEIGDNAKILPNSLVLPKTKIPAGETWGGVPAQKISLRQMTEKRTAAGE